VASALDCMLGMIRLSTIQALYTTGTWERYWMTMVLMPMLLEMNREIEARHAAVPKLRLVGGRG